MSNPDISPRKIAYKNSSSKFFCLLSRPAAKRDSRFVSHRLTWALRIIESYELPARYDIRW